MEYTEALTSQWVNLIENLSTHEWNLSLFKNNNIYIFIIIDYYNSLIRLLNKLVK